MQRQLLFNCSTQRDAIALNDSRDPILNTRLALGQYYFRLIGLIVILTTLSISATFAQTMYDISLEHTVDSPTATVGDTVEFTIVLSNLDGVATDVEVTDSLYACLLWDATLTPTTFTSTGGATANYNPATHEITWTVASLSLAETDTLRFKAVVDCEGVSFSKAEVTSVAGGVDVDSNPGNYDYGEDDIATACVSVPIRICVPMVKTTPRRIAEKMKRDFCMIGDWVR